ncbi:MAG: hypothetical protein A2W80_00180 [Candidatus Riflebacteria bacterium GWC2_50_8]|nr:MAG: hypothetical protein A2W80_00180 [Candidatus Riflebacteria bacterium GWC2_50_8]
MKLGRRILNSVRRGSAMFLLMTVVGILYIFGMMLINYMTQERTQTAKLGENLQAFYLAEAAVEKAMIKMRELFNEKLLSEDGEVNDRILGLLDIDRAENFNLRIRIADGEIINGGSAEVLVEVNNLRLTPFKTYIDEYEDVPPSLKVYRKENRDTYSDKALGGWEGLLRFEAVGKYRNAERKLEVIRDLKVTDLTPPAENYTLFVASRKDEYLRHGEFRCRNWSVVRDLKGLIDDLAVKTKNAFQETLGNAASDFFWEPNMASNVSFEGEIKVKTLKVIRKLVMSVSDLKIKDFVDLSIQKLHPYLWGKIRTNGRLHVYLPFFAADDIVNYFEDNSIFSHQRPEIGYLFCNNQLHDPYLSKYTYYEGEIIRYYQKLKPYVLGITETPYPSSDPYTINTKFDFVSRNSDKLEPMQLDRIKKNAKDYCHEFIERDLTLQGTYSKPAAVMGLIYVQGNLMIGGRISGQAMIVTEGDIIITEDLVQDSAAAFLSLVSLNGSVKLARELKSAKIESAIYAKESIVGGEQINIFGNLVVDSLNRQKGEEGALIMPKKVMINYDSKLKSEVGSNVCFNISDLITTMRDL